MGKRVHLDPKSQSKSMTSAPERPSLFGEPQLLEGENAADYHELVARLYAAVKPVDIIDEMFITDVASLQWEVLRWRRLKLNLIREPVLEALPAFLDEQVEYDLQSEADARAQKINELVQEYARHNPDAVTQIQKLLANAGRSMDALLADQLVENRDYLEYIERIDRLTTIAESRRNAALREIDRRRAILGQTLRRSLQEVEDAEFKVIEPTPTKGKVRLEERSQN
jgi:hypothetical protein